ncbi:MAG: pyridoxal phosphate-dependent aminotransferase [Gammaproteobacteria bacterium]|nr:MAG: pyridoxal phosphate-dependent aminotransferase [Gammaproteobacteria bacterium]
MTRFARRLAGIEPFHVMDILARARALEAQGHSVVHMEIGEPDFPTAPGIVEAGIAALKNGHTHYTPSLGLPALRAAIATNYPASCRPDPARVIVTPGASGALQLVFAALLSPGDEVLMADPGYPCNRHFVRLFEGGAAGIPVDSSTNYQLTADIVRRHWTPKTVAVLLASPSNPTGTLVPSSEMRRIAETVRELGGVLVVDEIYHGLTYGVDAESALQCGPDVFVINSFSKYYGMTGWRLGWVVAPEAYVPALDKLAQNIFLAASTPAQHAALAAFTPGVKQELERRREIFRTRRDYLLPALRELGFRIPVTPEGAFYLYADCSDFTGDSEHFANELLEQAGVAITPGIDFGTHRARSHVRFSYANTRENLEEGVRRLAEFLRR